MVFSDITPELRLMTQFNHLIEVQRATLDKLGDAVAVFGADGRPRLHNEAFATLVRAPRPALETAENFEAVVALCESRLPDLAFWRDLKGRITTPDPVGRAPASGEAMTAEGRTLAWQSRPLPDGATLIAFADVTDARALQGAVDEREAALRQSERLKRDFVANVSHQLRNPLTTILGYAERLERGVPADSPSRGQARAVKRAADELARLIGKVLAIAQLDSGELVLSPSPVDLDTLIAAAQARWSSAAAGAKLDLKVAGAPATGRC